MDDLNEEFEQVKDDVMNLKQFQNKISNLKFLDPAMGCGNFFVVTYLYLAELERNIIKRFIELGVECKFKVNTGQFYGIEIDDEACKIAVESLRDIHNYINEYYKNVLKEDVSGERLFLMPKIVNANALETNWETVVSKKELNYIIGNPPFIGSGRKTTIQREDMERVFGKKVKHGLLDYVCAWFKKATEYMQNTKMESAFVSTNSISQGEQPAILWEPLMKENNTVINFAYRTFKWGNEAKVKKAVVNCIIIGFSDYQTEKRRKFIMTKRI